MAHFADRLWRERNAHLGDFRNMLLAASALLLLSLPTQTLAQDQEQPPKLDPHVITLRADPSCPSNCDPESDHPGYDIEIARAIYGPAGYSIDYRLLSWSRTIIEVRNGSIDGFVAGIKDDAPDFVFPEEPAGLMINGFAIRHGSSWRWTGPDSLKGKVLGYIPDYQYFPELKAYIEAHAQDPKAVQGVAMMNAGELNLRKLVVGRIDVTSDDMLQLQYEVNKIGLGDKIDVIPANVGDPVPNYIAFGPTNPRAHELARLWDEGVRRLRKNGELKRILDRYGIKDWK